MFPKNRVPIQITASSLPRFAVTLFIILLLPFHLLASEPSEKQTICLNMIVKNESDVILRCLRSVLPLIDYWVIVDTGSTDGTQQMIKEFMEKQGLKGELYERPWVNFEHNRNEALVFAKGKGDYLFFIDADEYLQYDSNFRLPRLDHDFYYITMSHSGTKYQKTHLISSRKDWKWIGVLHEYISPPADATHSTLAGISNIYTNEGARSKNPRKYLDDAEILEAALKEDPDNCRTVFYLAQSYLDAKEYPKALEFYQKRAEMGGWPEEVFWAKLRVAIIKETMGYSDEEVNKSFFEAYTYRPSRIEPLYHLALRYRTKQEYNLGYQVAKVALSVPQTKDALFVQQWIHDYGMSLELSICAWWTGKYEECQQLSLNLLKRDDLPTNIRSCVENNLNFAHAKLIENIVVQP